jgi:UDP-glucose 4-epimerase
MSAATWSGTGRAGDEVVVLDDLRKGTAAPCARARSGGGGHRRPPRPREVFAAWRFEAVFHFAALSLVGESMREPLRYCAENLSNSLRLAEAAVKAGLPPLRAVLHRGAVRQSERTPIDETADLAPTSAYGESKLMVERGLSWAEGAHGLRSALPALLQRGGRRSGRAHRRGPRARNAPDPAGDLRRARHAAAADRVRRRLPHAGRHLRPRLRARDRPRGRAPARAGAAGARSCRYNLGSGTGYSVREVIEAVERVGGRPVPHHFGERRAGDPAVLVASSQRLRDDTGWSPRFGALDEIVRTAWAWHASHPRGYDDRSKA